MESNQFRFRLGLVIFLGTLLAGTLGFMFVENMTPADAAYFCIVTVSTVGFGDLQPVTPTGRLLIVSLILVGVGSLLFGLYSAAGLLLDRHASSQKTRKQALLVGLFFSELGMLLMAVLAGWDEERERLGAQLQIDDRSTAKDFARMRGLLEEHTYEIDKDRVDFHRLHQLLADRKGLLLRLLEHPSLLEKDRLTDLLQAVVHVYEELTYRLDIRVLSEADRQHLVGDSQRLYRLLVPLWLDHIEHLRGGYPYLFMYAAAMNPFRRETAATRQRVAV
ncbi:MAG: potassium channel family protein [bacterium]